MWFIKCYKWIEDFWFRVFPEKVRYLLVGGFNTVFALGLYWGLFYLLWEKENLALVCQYIISINVSVLTMRYYVFRSKGNFKAEYLKGVSVYLFVWGANVIGLNFLVQVCKMYPPYAQTLYSAIAMILTYVLHKYFSFREKKE